MGDSRGHSIRVTHDIDTVSERHFQARSKEEKACKCDFDLISMLFLERLERTQRMVFIRFDITCQGRMKFGAGINLLYYAVGMESESR